MKPYYTANELAGLPGMTGTERGVQRQADREAWPYQKRDGKGGGREYALASLPAETREYLLRMLLPNPIPLPASPLKGEEKSLVVATIQPATAPAQLKQWQRTVMEAKVALMRIIERAAPEHGVNKAIEAIVEDSFNNDLSIYKEANARRGLHRRLSYDGIMKWWRAWKNSGRNELVLAPKDTENYLEPAWAKPFMVYWCKGQNPCLTDVLYIYYRETGLKIPTYEEARRYLRKIGLVQASKGRVTGKDLRAMKPFRRRDTADMYPGDAYTADGHCFDAEWYHPFTGKAFRPEVIPTLDVASRKCVGWSVDVSANGLASLDSLRVACEIHGIPAIYYTDNGKEFKNQMLTTQGIGLIDRLGITPKYSRPRNPQAHGLSERAHQTILIKAAQQMCTYIGHKMDEDTKQKVFKDTRKAMKEGVKSDLMPEYDEGILLTKAAVEHYNDTPHKGLPAMRDPISKKLVHQSPNQAWQMGLERMKRELPQDEWLVPAGDQPDLYHPAIERQCWRGEIRFGKLSNGLPKIYFSKELEHWHGETVQVSYCPSDASRVWVRDLEHQRLLAVAELKGNSSPYFALTTLEEARQKRGKSALKRLENRADDKRLEMEGPKTIKIEPLTPEESALQEQLKIELKAKETSNVRDMEVESTRMKYKRMKALRAVLTDEGSLSEDDYKKLLMYEQTPEYRAQKGMEEEFGAAYR